MAQRVVLGEMTDSGSTLTLEGNAIKTEESIIALSNITQIKCIDDTPQYKLNWKLILVLAVVGIILFAAGNAMTIILGILCFAGIGFLVYSHFQKLKNKIYALVIELSAGSKVVFHSDDLTFLNSVKSKVFEAVQNGAARTSYVFDMSKNVINTINNTCATFKGDSKIGNMN